MNQITNFWNHFRQNNFVFLLLNEIPKDELKVHFNKLIYLLHQYNKDLDLIIKNKSKDAELIITANGNPYLFKEVELLVHYAPVIERWKIISFLQPETNLIKYKNCVDKPLEYYGVILKISEMYFEPLKIQNKPLELGIRVYVKNQIVSNYNPRLREAVYIHLEHVLGEKSFANHISLIDIAQIPNDYDKLKLIELYNIAVYIEDFKGFFH
ncbi:hypothetical protein [Flavobacterium aquatile]|uniref:Uncharacterized protein n=1 Tax=Flavobacterium aquatile LMG 4008 = ATCC 11947 TaxID=1453498 RepID=A0A095SRH1_9FLAO|nr:hypothetical protein [Flavobacterium aquatile]KGD66959.1 hypothetical protein LG45_16195 [Flavobacterium aquatile LMG 4008 = ATCC 11947]OXA68052.1 hypothetical protein B0A61_06180 [Flavobacterium aquatile LMG 4008 = ATCC 11947]GEC80084.1 hypothetical protein FAQ01_29540 [Flavobacterium aquatile]